MHKVNLANAFTTFSDFWSPKIAGEINICAVKLVKIKGAFEWHHHQHEDEFFLVVAGRLRMGLRDMKTIVLLATSFLASQQPYGYCENKPRCKENPQIVAACFSVHARANLGADSVPIYLWPVGTRRRLGVTGGPTLDDSIKPIYPKNLQFHSSSDSIFGEFEVCPFTPEKKDHLRLVCIESATHLVTKH